MASANGYKKLEVGSLQRQIVQEDVESDLEDDSDTEADGKALLATYVGRASSGISHQVAVHDVNEDTWIAMLFVIIFDWSEILGLGEARKNRPPLGALVLRLVGVSFALMLNLFLQFLFISFVLKYIVSPAVATFQDQYYEFHRDCFNYDAAKASWEFNKTTWKTFPHSKLMCESGLAQPAFLFTILFLWTLRMLQEFVENLTLYLHLRNIPDLPPGCSSWQQMYDHWSDGQRKIYVVALTPLSRCGANCLIVVPRFLVMTSILYLGWRWLAASESPDGLILNALALEFIINIDEMIFAAFFPNAMAEKIKEFKLVEQQEDFESAEEAHQAKDGKTVYEYSRSLCFLIVAFLALLAYITLGQTIIPGYNGDLHPICSNDRESHKLRCGMEQTGAVCFPYGPGAEL